MGGERDGEHCEGLGGAASTDGPRQQAGEEDSCGSAQGGDHADAGEGVAEDGFGEAGLDGDEGDRGRRSPNRDGGRRGG